jgi:phage terminase Nu1 subunit (DNA packaging protein)
MTEPTDTFTVSKLAELLEIDRRVLRRMLEPIEPVHNDGRSKFYELRQVIKSIRGPSAQAEKARLDSLRADVVELDLAAKKGELIPVETVLEIITPMYANCRTRLLAIPVKAAIEVAAMEDKNEIQDKLEAFIHEALEELSNAEPLAILGEGAAKIAKTAAEIESKRMGRQIQEIES